MRPLARIYEIFKGMLETNAAMLSKVDNYKDAILYVLKIKKNILLKFKDGFEIEFDDKNRSSFFTLLNLMFYHGVSFSNESSMDWKIDLKNGIVKTHQGIALDISTLDTTIIPETFIYDIHFIGFNLGNKKVIDIGAYVGDTALYYANLGALVYAYEPNPFNFRFLLRNLELNPSLKDRIKAYNYAVGKDCEIEIEYI